MGGEGIGGKELLRKLDAGSFFLPPFLSLFAGNVVCIQQSIVSSLVVNLKWEQMYNKFLMVPGLHSVLFMTGSHLLLSFCLDILLFHLVTGEVQDDCDFVFC